MRTIVIRIGTELNNNPLRMFKSLIQSTIGVKISPKTIVTHEYTRIKKS